MTILKSIFCLIISCSLLSITIIHIYWLLGGRWGIDKAIPTAIQGNTPLFMPSRLATLVVAMGFLGMTSIVWAYYFQWVSPNLIKPFVYAIAGIFMLRGIGDFNYVGLFKKVKSTIFAQMDTQYYTPLCLILGVVIYWFV
jgi:Protein of unknown function (DUF3995)